MLRFEPGTDCLNLGETRMRVTKYRFPFIEVIESTDPRRLRGRSAAAPRGGVTLGDPVETNTWICCKPMRPHCVITWIWVRNMPRALDLKGNHRLCCQRRLLDCKTLPR